MPLTNVLGEHVYISMYVFLYVGACVKVGKCRYVPCSCVGQRKTPYGVLQVLFTLFLRQGLRLAWGLLAGQ